MEKEKNKETIVGKVVELEKMLNYQEEAVVSRTVIDKKIGTVTVFAFDKGQGLSEHRAPYDALVYVIDGCANVVIEKKEFTLKKGEMIIMPADKRHSLKAIEKFKMVLIMIRA